MCAGRRASFVTTFPIFTALKANTIISRINGTSNQAVLPIPTALVGRGGELLGAVSTGRDLTCASFFDPVSAVGEVREDGTRTVSLYTV